MQTKKVRVVGRSVTALAMGLALTVGSASLASADGHHGPTAKGHDYASAKVSPFDYAKVGRGGYVISATATLLTVQRWNGTTTTYTLTPTTTYSIGSTPASFTALVSGDRVRVQLSSTTPPTALSVTIELVQLSGIVTGKNGLSITIMDSDGFSRTIVTSLTTKFTMDGAISAMTSVADGSRVFAEGSIDTNGTSLDASSVVIHAAGHKVDAQGVITAVSTSSVTVLSNRGTSTTFTFAPTATFKQGNTTILESALAIGQSVHLEFNSTAPTTALSINVKPSGHKVDAQGVITAVSTSSVTVLRNHGTSTSFTFAPTATFKQGNTTILESALAIGQSVHLEFNSTAPTTALSINVKLSNASGQVAAISGNTITITSKHGTISSIVVSPTATKYTNEGGTATTFANVIVGAKISAQGTLSPDKSTLNASSVTIDNDANAGPAVSTNKTSDQS
jgi:hypothetical protein